MDRASHPFLLATERKCEFFLQTDRELIRVCFTDDRVKLPSNPSRKVKGVDVLPWVLSPLMGPEEIDMEVRGSRYSAIS